MTVSCLFSLLTFDLFQMPPPRKRHKTATRELWKSNVNKNKRQQGQPYQTRHGCEKPARKMGPPCTSSYCQKSKSRGCNNISEEQRTQIHSQFWAMSTWDERRTYVQTLVQKCQIKQKTKGSDSPRQTSLLYSFNVDGQLIQVCNRLFSSTLGISERTIRSWLSPEGAPCPESESSQRGHFADPTSTRSSKSPKSGPRAAVSADESDFLKWWLLDLPAVPSHYCRNLASYRDKRFLYPGTLLSDLYARHAQADGANGVRSVSLTYFRHTFTSLNLSVLGPLLFCMFTNDLPMHIASDIVNCEMFADDKLR